MSVQVLEYLEKVLVHLATAYSHSELIVVLGCQSPESAAGEGESLCKGLGKDYNCATATFMEVGERACSGSSSICLKKKLCTPECVSFSNQVLRKG